MPLPTNLTTNEVKDRAGVEVEFNRFDTQGRTTIFAVANEVPSAPHRLKVAHQETGSGQTMTRRSLVRVDKVVTGKSGKPCTISMYKVGVIPVGELDDLNAVKDVSAELDSFCTTTGAGTTVLFDGSGSGSAAIINGTQ